MGDVVTSLLQWSLYCLQELTNFATPTASKYYEVLVNLKACFVHTGFPLLKFCCSLCC